MHISGGMHANVDLHGNDLFQARMKALHYSPVVDGEASAESLASVQPKQSVVQTFVVDRSNNTLMLRGPSHVPEKVRGSDPSFALDKIYPMGIVHAFLFRSKEHLGDQSANTITMGIFDISECDGEDFRMLSIEQRQSRLRFLFGQAWFRLQHQAMMLLCKRLQNSKSTAQQQLGQAILSKREESGWTAEFLNTFAEYAWREHGSYKELVANMSEMQAVIRPIPAHIQLMPVMTVRQCRNMRSCAETCLPGGPAFGGTLVLPEHIGDAWPCSCTDQEE